MDLPVMQMERTAARKAFMEYRAAVQVSLDKEAQEWDEKRRLLRVERRKTDEAIMAGYRLIAEGKQIIQLSDAIKQGGEDQQHRPRLAVARADEKRVRCWRRNDGSVSFRGQTGRNYSNHTDPRTATSHALPAGTFERVSDFGPSRFGGNVTTLDLEAIVPLIPPRFRPAQLERYHILWEADWKAVPRDPALLRALGGDLYAVVAVWDLTDIERAVLGRNQ